MKKLFLLLIALSACFSLPVQAGSADWGSIAFPLAHPNAALDGNGAIFFRTDGTRTGIPACATSTFGQWAINTTTSLGRAQLTILMTAYALGKRVRVSGNDLCSIWIDREDVLWIQIDN